PAAQLGDDVGRRAEAVKTDVAARSSDGERSPADQAGAEERGGRDRIGRLRQPHHEGRVGDDVGGKAPIARVAGELWPLAQVLAPPDAIAALPAGISEPRHANAL